MQNPRKVKAMSLYKPTYREKKTGELKESNIWWYAFIYQGRRYRQSTHTTRKTLAENREKNRHLELERASTGTPAVDHSKKLRTLRDAITNYQAAYNAPNHRAKSIAWVKERCPHLIKHLGAVALLDLTEDRIRQYMRTRRDEKAGHRTINMELDILARAAGHSWRILWPKVPKLEEPKDVGRALSPEEEGRILGAAMENRSPYILPFIRIALSTGMRFGEIRTLQLSRLDLVNRELRVGKAKTPAGRGRGIPMTADLFETISAQVESLREAFGPPQPEWYLFPFSSRVKPVDPLRPITTIKSSWEAVRETANVNCRFHDLRHTAATKLGEHGVPEATMKALLGHMSKAMLERYSHIRTEAKRAAVQGLALATPIIALAKESTKVRKKRLLRTAATA
jgi:integrase